MSAIFWLFLLVPCAAVLAWESYLDWKFSREAMQRLLALSGDEK